MDFNAIQIILVLIVAFLAGLEGILDAFQFHQPIIACTLIGLATGHLSEAIILGGSLQIIALASVAPDAALASVASAIIYIKGNDFSEAGRNLAIGTAITLATVGLVLTMVVRTLAVGLVHRADAAAEKGDFRGVAFWHYVALSMQGLRIMIPAGALLFVSSEVVQGYLKLIPEWFANGMTIGGNMVVAVGLAMVINLMASKETWPFFFIGFAIAPLNELTLIATGVIALSLAFIYLNLSNNSGNGSAGGNSGSGDPLGDILNDY